MKIVKKPLRKIEYVGWWLRDEGDLVEVVSKKKY